VTGSCELGNEHSVSVNTPIFLDQLRHCQVLNKDSGLRRSLFP
jgi:hypothetical protein